MDYQTGYRDGVEAVAAGLESGALGIGWGIPHDLFQKLIAQIRALTRAETPAMEPRYPLDAVPIPSGWERVAYRDVAFDEYFLTAQGSIGYQDGGVHFDNRPDEPDTRRIIVRKVEKPTPAEPAQPTCDNCTSSVKGDCDCECHVQASEPTPAPASGVSEPTVCIHGKLLIGPHCYECLDMGDLKLCYYCGGDTIHAKGCQWINEPTKADLDSSEFIAVWNVIRKWDISRYNESPHRMYSGATGTDVMTILNALRTTAPPAAYVGDALIRELVAEFKHQHCCTARYAGVGCSGCQLVSKVEAALPVAAEKERA